MEAIVRGSGEVTLLVDETIYSRIALLKACYWFTDRCYLFIYRHDERQLAVNFKSKSANESLESIVGEFQNSLLDHQLRSEIYRETATLRELIVAKAFAEGNLLEDAPGGDDRDPVEIAGLTSQARGSKANG